MFEQTICVLRVFPGREKVNGNQKTFPTGLRQEPDNKRSEFNFVRFLNVLLNSDVFSYQYVDIFFSPYFVYVLHIRTIDNPVAMSRDSGPAPTIVFSDSWQCLLHTVKSSTLP